MPQKFIVRHKDADSKEDKHTIMSLRIERALQEEYEYLAHSSGRSRNELMCMALKYALDNLEFIPE